MSPSYQHSYVQGKLIAALQRFQEYTAFSELSLAVGEKEFVPDVCVYPYRKINFTDDDILRMTEMPLLVIEILSPSQTILEAKQKIAAYLAAGVKSCWLVLPTAQTVTIYAESHHGLHVKTGDVVDPILNIRIAIDEIFGIYSETE